MPLVTDSITYNVNTRGRKFRGVDRCFDTVALARLINGGPVQEMVKHGDMLGYFGHWPRQKFGMQVTEGGIDPDTGKPVVLPVAIRTIELRAEADGTITHRTEFLDTEAGQLAESLYRNKVGGFSSAIDPVPRTMPMVPRGFHGFDWIYEPNYTTNRGHKVVLDAIGADAAAILDSTLALAAQEQEQMAALFDSLHAQHLDLLDVVERQKAELDWAIARLAKQTGQAAPAVLDSMALESVMPQRTEIPDFERFRHMPRAGFGDIKPPAGPTPEERAVYSHYGV